MSRSGGMLRNVFAGLIAGTLLLMPAVGQAAAQKPKQKEPVVNPPTASGPKKVSPYATLNRQRREAAEKERERSKKGAPSQSRLHPVSVRKH
jgi:hypothetical protein